MNPLIPNIEFPLTKNLWGIWALRSKIQQAIQAESGCRLTAAGNELN